MPPLDKRAVEMRYGKALLTLLRIEAPLEPGVEPAPDLLFSHAGRTIGVEHTRLFADNGGSPTSFQSHERALDTIAEMAQIEYARRGLPPVEVKLFLPQARPGKVRIPILVAWIVDAVERNLPENPGTSELRNTWTGDMPNEIDCIRMIRFNGQVSTSFFSPRAAFLQSIDAQWLQNKIDEKVKRLPGYLSRCDEAWLLLVEEQTGLASTIEIPESVYSEFIIKGGFARIFLLRRKTELHEFKEA